MNSELDRLADRHLRQDPHGALAPAERLVAGRVRVCVSASEATTWAGQHAAWLLVNLLSRQFRVISSIELHVPTVRLLDGVAAFDSRDTLDATLRACVLSVAGEHIRVVSEQADAPTQVQLVVGGEAVQGGGVSVYLQGRGWRAYVGDRPMQPGVIGPDSPLTFGPYLAACVAAGEVFKRLRGLVPGKGEFVSSFYASAWSMRSAPAWDQLQDGPSSLDLPELGHVYIPGAGAVGQAAALTIGSSRLAVSVTTVDHDPLDLTNNNRYCLARKADADASKPQLVANFLKAAGILCNPRDEKWQEYVAACGANAIAPEVSAQERRFMYPTILSSVDKNSVRHALQQLLPRLIIGGSTEGLVAKAIAYDLSAGTRCLKCFNPIEGAEEVLQPRLEAARAASDAERQELCVQLGIKREALESILAGPKCGELPAADLERFAAGPPQMSAGFVSVAAGVLQVAQWVRVQLLGTAALIDGESVFLTFARPALRVRHLAPQSSCQCANDLRDRWKRLWANP